MKNTEFKVKASDFLTAVKRVKHCMGDNEARRNLMGINLSVTEEHPERLNIMAADTFRIARQSIAVTAEEPFNITINHYIIKDRLIEKYLKQYEKTDRLIKCRIQENTFYILNDSDIPFKCKLKDEEYPTNGINSLLINAESEENKITVKDINNFYRASEYLYNALESDYDIKRQSVLKLSLDNHLTNHHGDQRELILKNAVPDNSEEFRQVSFNISAEDGKAADHIGLNIRFLKEALKVFKNLKAYNLTISYKNSESPCFFKTETADAALEAGNTFIQVILPVKLKYV